MISNRPQNYKKTGIFIQKHAKHTRFSAIFFRIYKRTSRNKIAKEKKK